jgi:DNA-binding transcriptional LysR family regulator
MDALSNFHPSGLPGPDGEHTLNESQTKHPVNERVFARNVDWNLFKDFLELVRHGGIGAAARATGRQQPSMSAALKRLEDHLNVKLFQRGARGLTLTPAGRAVAELCGAIFGCVLSMPHRAAEAAGMLEGLVTIRMMSDIVVPALDTAMLNFHERYSGVQIRLDIAAWRAVVDSVARGEADIGIACDSAPREDLRYVAIASETQQLYCQKDSAIFGVAARPPADFADNIFVLTGEDEPDELANFRRRYGLGRKVSGTADTLQEARRLIELGFGIGFLPTVVAAPYVKAGALWPLLPESLLPTYHIYMVTHAALPRGAPAALVVDAITKSLSDKI